MKQVIIFGLIFIVGCGGRTLTRTEYQDRRPENFHHISQICADQEPWDECVRREKEKVYKNYTDTPSFPQRYLDRRRSTQSNRTAITNQPQQKQHGTPVYSADECTGPVISGRCHGAIIPKTAVPKRCYGTMLFGECTGPMF